MAENINHLLFNAHALMTDRNESHAREGNHLRVSTHPLLGLPVAPFIVSRGQIFLKKEARWRKDAVFISKTGAAVLLPFDVSEENPLTVYIPNGPAGHCIWAQINAQGLTQGEEVKLTCDAYMDSALGPALIGRRRAPRYAFSGPSIRKIEITGRGRVTDIQWLADTDLKGVKFEPFAIMNLPHEGGLRYVAIIGAKDFARKRVEMQAPWRQPLQETSGAPAPFSAPPADESFEVSRVDSLTPTLSDDLDRLINDASTLPLLQEISEQMLDSFGREIGRSKIKRMSRVLQQQADHGTASHIGYKMLDVDFIGRDEQLIVYRVEGYFCDFPPDDTKKQMHHDQQAFDALLTSIPLPYRSLKHQQVIEQFFGGTGNVDGIKRNERIKDVLEPAFMYVSLGAYAIADIGAPLDQVERVRITGTEQSSWIPVMPPDAQREIEVSLQGVRVAGLLASCKRTPGGISPFSFYNLNKANSKGFHIPLALSLDYGNGTSPPPVSPGTGFIADRQAAASDIRYFVAQQDRFGRWSEWVSALAPEGVRPRPPRPQVQASYVMPSMSQAATAGGQVTVRVPVPETESLAPGSHLLHRARISSKDLNTNITQTFDVLASTKTTADPAPVNANDPPQRYQVAQVYAGPILQATEVRKLEISAFWIDTNGAISVESEKQILKLNDPRPPAQISVPDMLQYSARPDVTGLAWIEHRWLATAGQANFSVYYTDENRLQAHLKATNAQGILNSLSTAAHAAARATIYRTNAALFPDHVFEKLRDVMQSFNSGEKGFRHAVSGSLRVLNFYKIAAEAASGGRPVLTGLPLIVYGVPNSDPPPRPALQVKPTTSGAVDVTIMVSPGATRARSWRLRRTRGEARSVTMMPVVATGQFAPTAQVTDPQIAEHMDTGPLQISATATILPWVRYTWVAEVQGVPESGSVEAGTPVAGRWSVASDPVSLVLIPDTPPNPVTFSLTATAGTGGFTAVSANITPPAPLLSGTMGAFKLKLQRQLPSGPPEVLTEVDADGAGPFDLSGHPTGNLAEVVPSGTSYSVILLDPLGRQSASSVQVLA